MKKNQPIITVVFMLLLALVYSSCDQITPDPPTPVEELGEILWTYDDFDVIPEVTEPVQISGVALGDDGTIYVSVTDRVGAYWQLARVHAINSDSTFKWSSPELESAYPSDPVVGPDGTVYVICSTTIYALNSASGTIMWEYHPPEDNNERHDIGWLTLGNDGQVFFAHIASGAYARRIYALNSDGNVLWKLDVNWGAGHLAVGIDGTLFAYWTANGDIRTFSAFDPENGSTKWSKVLEYNPRGIAISPDGNPVISFYYPKRLAKIDATTGEYIWDIEVGGEGYPSIAPDGSIYLVSSDLYCYNPDGTLKWQTGSYVGGGSKIAIDSEGSAYGSITDHGEGNFQVFKSDGILRWAIPQAMTTLQCPAIGSNNVVYVTVSAVPKATIYAIQGDKPIASSGWSRDNGGNRNTRNVNLN